MTSWGSVGHVCTYGNAIGETIVATPDRELLSRRRIKSLAEANMAVFEWIEVRCKPRRRRLALDHRSPVNYERAHRRDLQSAKSFCRVTRQTALGV